MNEYQQAYTGRIHNDMYNMADHLALSIPEAVRALQGGDG